MLFWDKVKAKALKSHTYYLLSIYKDKVKIWFNTENEILAWVIVLVTVFLIKKSFWFGVIYSIYFSVTKLIIGYCMFSLFLITGCVATIVYHLNYFNAKQLLNNLHKTIKEFILLSKSDKLKVYKGYIKKSAKVITKLEIFFSFKIILVVYLFFVCYYKIFIEVSLFWCSMFICCLVTVMLILTKILESKLTSKKIKYLHVFGLLAHFYIGVCLGFELYTIVIKKSLVSFTNEEEQTVFFFEDYNLLICFCLNVIFLLYHTTTYSQASRINVFEEYLKKNILTWSLFSVSLVLLVANDLVTILTLFEIIQILNYGLLLKKKKQVNLEAILKYYIFNFISSIFLLAGLLMVFFSANASNLKALCIVIESQPSGENWIIGSFMCFLISFFIKVGIFPFSYYLPNLYMHFEKAGVVVFIMVNVLFYTAVYHKFFLSYQRLLLSNNVSNKIILLVAFLTILYATIYMMYEVNIYKFLAYSSISLSGFMLLGIAVGSRLASVCAFNLVLVYAIGIILLLVVLFGLCKSKIYDESIIRHEISNLSDLAYLKEQNPITCIFIFLSIFNLAGLPPFAVFIAKFSLWLEVYLQVGYQGLVLYGLCSFLSCLPYFRLLKIVYFTRTKKEQATIISKRTINLDFFIALVLILVLGLYFIWNFTFIKIFLIISLVM